MSMILDVCFRKKRYIFKNFQKKHIKRSIEKIKKLFNKNRTKRKVLQLTYFFITPIVDKK